MAPHNLRRRKGTQSSTRGPFISFGVKSTFCLGIFMIIYAISMLSFIPALQDEQKAQKIKDAKDNIIKRKKALVGHVKKEGQAWKKEINKVRRKGREAIEKELMERAFEQFQENDRPHPKKNTGKQERRKSAEEDRKNMYGNRARILDKGIHVNKPKIAPHAAATTKKKTVKKAAPLVKKEETEKHNNDNDKPTTGFMVLGMHRSGTSMLSGLLVEGFGYKTGGPLIQPAFDNEKGFFELIPAVLQNDEFFYEQNMSWAGGVHNYNAQRALDAYKSRKIKVEKGIKALKVLNSANNVPWLQKDPRMCITLRTWLPLLNSKPAVIFTYRNPLEVALSLHKRENGFTILRGLRLWIKYNEMAVRNSFDLCSVRSNNNAVLADPLKETTRIVDELTTKCHVPAAPRKITEEIVNSFVDPNLQHNKKKLENANKNIVATYNDGACEVKEFVSQLKDNKKKLEEKMYLSAMKVYCDLESGAAYEADYKWPDELI